MRRLYANDDQPSRTSAILVIGAMALMAIAAMGVSDLNSAPASAASDRAERVPARMRWTIAQVEDLIGELRYAQRHGIDAEACGLSALRGEVLQTREVFGRQGSPQLDSLAESATLALAQRYGHVTAKRELKQTLTRNDLREWLRSLHAGLPDKGA